MESDYEEEDWHGNLTNRCHFDNEVVIEGVSNDYDKHCDLNCSNALYAHDEDMNDHDEQENIPIPSSKDLGLGSSDNESYLSFSTAKNHKSEHNLSDSKFSSSDLSVVSKCESKKENRKLAQDNMKFYRRKVNKNKW